MMIHPDPCAGTRRSAHILSKLLRSLAAYIRQGITGLDVQDWCIQQLKSQYGSPSLFGLEGFPGQISINRNATAAHAAPDDEPFSSGDLVTVDIAIDVLGWKADLAWTYGVPPLSEASRHLLVTAWKASLLPLYAAAGADSGRKSALLLEKLLAETQLQLCQGFAGHGIGREVHLQPIIPYFPTACRFPDMTDPTPVFCWEPILTDGNGIMQRDERTMAFHTADASQTAQFEHMFIVSDSSIDILNLDLESLKQGSGLRGTPPW